MTLLWDRVTSKLIFPADLNDCWGWSGAHSHKRHGQKRPIIREGGKGSRVVSVARLMCTWFHGDPPTPHHEAGHTCPKGENCGCVNPRHLEWMTRVENEQYKQMRASACTET